MELKRIGAKKGKIGIITLKRPEKLNAIDMKAIEELEKTLSSMEKDSKVKVIIFTGTGNVFCAGADIKMMSSFSRDEAKKFALRLNRLLTKVENFKKPVIAAINGFALGAGNELAIACDIRIASPRSKFGQPEVRLGISPGAGATIRLPRIIGLPKAKELIYTGKVIDARNAEKMGLVNKISNDPLKEAVKMATEIMENSMNAVNASKLILNKPSALIQDEIKQWIKFFGAHDQKEGMKAFLEKRKARFKE